MFYILQSLQVCIAARSTDKLELLQKEIEISGGISTFFKCDITKRNEVSFIMVFTAYLENFDNVS